VQDAIKSQWQIIGSNIKKYRTRHKLSLRNLGTKCGISASFLSQLERGTSGAHMATLMQIASVLHVSLSELTSDVQPGDIHFTAAASRSLLDDDEYHRKSLITRKGYGTFEVFIHSIDPGMSTSDEPYTHGHAQECIFILTGTVDVRVNTSTIRMNTGDALEYRSDMPHMATNVGEIVAEVMFIVGPDEP